MKGIYKKISVGVLAAALLVGAGGIAQGGQAFAASSSHSECAYYIKHQPNRNNDIEWVYSWYSPARKKEALKRDKELDLNVLEMWRKKGVEFSIKEQIGEKIEKNVKVDAYFDSVFDFVSYVDICDHKENKLKGEKLVKIGVFYYKVEI